MHPLKIKSCKLLIYTAISNFQTRECRFNYARQFYVSSDVTKLSYFILVSRLCSRQNATGFYPDRPIDESWAHPPTLFLKRPSILLRHMYVIVDGVWIGE
jgi:hypothetical protein